MRERLTGSRLGWVLRGGAILLLATSWGCNKETPNTDNLTLPSAGGLVVPHTPTPNLLSVTTSCEGDNPVIKVENWQVGGKYGKELDALMIFEKSPTNFRILAVLDIAGVRSNKELEDHVVLTYTGNAFTPDANYTDGSIPPFPKKGGERYWLERWPVKSFEWNGNRRVLRLKEYAKAKASVAFQVPHCLGKTGSSG